MFTAATAAAADVDAGKGDNWSLAQQIQSMLACQMPHLHFQALLGASAGCGQRWCCAWAPACSAAAQSCCSAVLMGRERAHALLPAHPSIRSWRHLGASAGGAHSRSVVSSIWQRVMAIREVLPVPDCACAMTSRPWVMGSTARCWMAEGFSKPNW